jgi:hypothetical protein
MNMKNKMIIIVTVLMGLFLTPLKAEKIMDLPELVNPQQMAVDGNRLYVVQDAEVFVFSLESKEHVLRFGKKGNGPGEFNPMKAFGMVMNIELDPEGVFLSTGQKCGVFSRDGEYKWEKRFPFMAGNVRKMGQQLVFLRFNQGRGGMAYSVSLSDKEITSVKELESLASNYTSGKFEPVQDFFRPRSANDKVYILNSKKGLLLTVYNNKGEKLKEITRPYNKVRVSESHKRQAEEWYKTKQWFKMIPEDFKKKIEYPEFLPVCKNFEIAGNTIYVHTFNTVDGKTEFLAIPVDGPGLKSYRLPVGDLNLLEYLPYCFHDNRFYHLVENDDEEWELHMVDLTSIKK